MYVCAFWPNNPATSYCFVNLRLFLESSRTDSRLFSRKKLYSVELLLKESGGILQVCFSFIVHVYFHIIWIVVKALALICFPCCWARFCCWCLIGFRQLRLWANQTVNFSSLTGLKRWSSCWFILPMGRLCKLRVWLQQAPSWVCFEKLLGSSITEGEKNEVYFKNLFTEKIW